MRLITNFFTPGEIESLITQWHVLESAGASWIVQRGKKGEEKRAYDFFPCLEPLPFLFDRALEELPLISGSHPYKDSFFLRYCTDDFVPAHLDNRSAIRLNVCLKAPSRGGHLVVSGQVVKLRPGDAVVFEPDVEVHAVTRMQGERLVWSVGRTRDPYCGGNKKCLQNQDPRWSP